MDNESIYNEIGKLIKKERKKKGITQEELAELTSYSLSFIANIESNTHQSFSLHTLYNIANALNIPINNLIPTKEEIQVKKYKLICECCSYNVSIPKEIGKLLEDIEKIANKKGKYICPLCQNKNVYLKII